MLPLFPTPHPDEIFFSICARFHQWSRNKRVSWTMNDLFGEKEVYSVSVDFPSHLNNLVKNLHHQSKMNSDLLVEDHSIARFYKPFLPKERVAQLESYMKGGGQNGGGKIIVGTSSSPIKDISTLRYCPSCIIQDRKQDGEAYWHRIHQIASVRVCPSHNVRLISSRVEKSKVQSLCTLEEVITDLDISQKDIETNKCHLEISKDIDFLLQNNTPSIGLLKLREKYLTLLKNKNLITPSGTIRHSKFLKEFYDYFGEETLNEIGIPKVLVGKKYWLNRILAEKEKVTHPIFHILLIRFLGVPIGDFFLNQENDFKPFGESPWVCLNPVAHHYKHEVINKMELIRHHKSEDVIGIFHCNCGYVYTRKGPDKDESNKFKKTIVRSYGDLWEKTLIQLVLKDKKSFREAGSILKVHHTTVRKQFIRIRNTKDVRFVQYRKQYRSKWLEVKTNNPSLTVNQLSQLLKKESKWLFANDNKWLEDNSPQKLITVNLTDEGRKRSKIDWLSRDKETSELLEEAAEEMKSSREKPIKLTKTSLGKYIGRLSILKHQIDKLPQTRLILESVLESNDMYWKRKVKWAFNTLVKDREEAPTVKHIIRKAGITNCPGNVIEFINELILDYNTI